MDFLPARSIPRSPSSSHVRFVVVVVVVFSLSLSLTDTLYSRFSIRSAYHLNKIFQKILGIFTVPSHLARTDSMPAFLFALLVSAAAWKPRDVQIIDGQFVERETGAIVVMNGTNVIMKGPPWLPTVGLFGSHAQITQGKTTHCKHASVLLCLLANMCG